MNWFREAACQEADPDLFFPMGKAVTTVSQLAAAKEICARCPVRAPCLEWALRTDAEYGVWGGMSEDERRIIRRRALHSRVTTW